MAEKKRLVIGFDAGGTKTAAVLVAEDGLVEKVGLSLICGTGSVGWGRNAKGKTSMTSCWGPIGDEGSAYDVARRGVNAAFWAWDGRGRKTVLVDKLLAMFDQTDLRDVCTPLYTSENLRKDFASLAKLVTEAADEGDRVALQIMRDCADQVACFLATCAENLRMHRAEGSSRRQCSGFRGRRPGLRPSRRLFGLRARRPRPVRRGGKCRL